MGFFSSRRAEPSPLPVERQLRHPGGESKSTVRLIRSKFYGKSKPLSIYHSSPATPSIPEASDPPDYYINSPQQHSTLTLLSTSSRTDARRSSTDAVTMTLAQRLNELAVANSEGLVDDNEYRLLRQSLFERFASVSTVPSESPVVKMPPFNKPAHQPTPSTSSLKSSIMRTPSLRTQTSISSTMSSLFRRATRRAAEKRSPQDNDNIYISHNTKTPATISTPPSSLIPQLSRQPSINSITTMHSRHIPHDLRSISSKRSGRSQAAFSDVNSTSRGFSRSLRSAEPPSSFHPKISGTVWYNDDDRLKTAADIRAEIRTVEIEERRLLEAFNGLEITASARHGQLDSETKTVDNAESYEYRSQGSVPTSIYNNVGCSPKRQTKQLCSTQSPAFSHGLELIPQPAHSSVASLHSEYMDGTTNSRDSPRADRTVLQQLPQVSNHTLNVEMDDIRRRRADIAVKYQERLAFLRARLKGAEMHERLLRK